MSGSAALTDLTEVTARLGSAREARWILEQGGDRWPELVARRLAGEPLQYVLGTWSFRRLELEVDRRVLIPRPETEQVVEVALAELTRLARVRSPEHVARPGPVGVDLGTGSAPIALALATEGRARCPGLEVWATDRSPDALAVAAANVARVGAAEPTAPVHLVEGDWFGALPPELARRVDVIVANPPYVAAEEMARLDPVVRDWEPNEALAAGPGRGGVPGLAAVEAIVVAAPRWLAIGGALVVEIDPRQAAAASGLARHAGFEPVRVERDLAGRDRVLVARR